MKSKIKENIQIGKFGTGANQVTDCDNIPAGAAPADIFRSCALTAGNYESGIPKYTYGGSAVGRFANVELGITAKRTGPRYIFDTNVPLFTGALGSPTAVEIFPSKAPAYWLVNLDARLKLTMLKGLEQSYFQLNVYNLFDQFYVGGFNGGLNQSFSGTNYGSPPFVSVGAPRTVSGTLSLRF
jgi:iron complex outermembrane receptor protein